MQLKLRVALPLSNNIYEILIRKTLFKNKDEEVIICNFSQLIFVIII